MKKQLLYLLFIIINTLPLHSQSSLDNYIKEGIRDNEIIKQQSFQLKRSLYALKEAKSLFYPSVSLEALYLKSEGGRSFDIPVGDLINPVFNTLNQLTSSNNFQNVNNMSIQFNPDNYYDAKFRFSMPILNAEILYNYKRTNALLDMQKIDILLYERELIKNIKMAYYQYCQSLKVVEIKNNIVQLTKEVNRLTQSLYDNGKINKTNLLRSEGKIKMAENDLFSAQQKLKNSKAYFNFLLNKSFESEVKVDNDDIFELKDMSVLSSENPTKREELDKIKIQQDISILNNKVERSYYIPKIETFLDLGSQSDNWKFDNRSRYYMFGISIKWNFSLGGKDLYRVKQTEQDINITKSQTAYVEKQLQLELYNAQNAFEESLRYYESLQNQYNIAEKYYSDTVLRFKQGIGLYIELLEAQNEYANTYLQLNIAYYDIYIKNVLKERATASLNLSSYENNE